MFHTEYRGLLHMPLQEIMRLIKYDFQKVFVGLERGHFGDADVLQILHFRNNCAQ